MSRQLTVYYTEVYYELSVFLTVEEQGADLKATVLANIEEVEEAEKADLFEVPDEDVPAWLIERDIIPSDVSWGELPLKLPLGWTLTKAVT